MRLPVIAALFGFATTACTQLSPPKEVVQEGVKTDTVKAFALASDSVRKSLVLPGELLPYRNAEIRPKTTGYIQKLNVDIGSRVGAGQVLALIDAPEVGSRLRELDEKVKAARSRYLTAKDYYDRISSAAKSGGVIAEAELTRAANQMHADSLEYSAAGFAAASYKQVGNYLAILAPYGGVVTSRNIVTGSLVGTPGEKPLFELADHSVLRLRVPVPEIYTGALLLKNTGELTTRAMPDRKFVAHLVRKSDQIDHDSRSEIWEFEIPNRDAGLKAGSYADVKLHFLRQKQNLVVPASAIVTTLERKFVIRIVNGTTEWVDVRPGFNMGEKVEVFGDLVPGDTLVQKGTEELKPGTVVIPHLSHKK